MKKLGRIPDGGGWRLHGRAEARAARPESRRTTGFDAANFRAVATRFDKRAYVVHGTVTVASIQLWLRT